MQNMYLCGAAGRVGVLLVSEVISALGNALLSSFFSHLRNLNNLIVCMLSFVTESILGTTQGTIQYLLSWWVVAAAAVLTVKQPQ